MHIYVYDGSFDGMLTACFDAYRDAEATDFVPVDKYEPDLLSEAIFISTDTEKTTRILRALEQKFSGYILHIIEYVYLSEAPHCEMLILRYLRGCFTYGSSFSFAKQNPVVHQMEELRQKVSHELNRIRGYLRLEEIDRLVFYGAIAPDHNILPLLPPTIESRFSCQKMIIHDKKRSAALLYDMQRCTIVPFSDGDARALLAKRTTEDDFMSLFQKYYQATTIESRTNLRLQDNWMPKRYRKYMPETQPKL